jgi:hypothetical protein
VPLLPGALGFGLSSYTRIFFQSRHRGVSLPQYQLNVAGAAHVGIDATMRAIRPSALLLRLVDLHQTRDEGTAADQMNGILDWTVAMERSGASLHHARCVACNQIGHKRSFFVY